jgi:hypothetical protein
LSNRVCSECGIDFDPADPVFVAQALGLPGWYHNASVLVAAWPVGVLCLLHAAYLLLRLTGAEARGQAWAVLWALTVGLALATPLITCVGLALLCAREGWAMWTRTDSGRRWAPIYLVLGVASWVLAAIWVAADPFGLVSWLMID